MPRFDFESLLTPHLTVPRSTLSYSHAVYTSAAPASMVARPIVQDVRTRPVSSQGPSYPPDSALSCQRPVLSATPSCRLGNDLFQ
eukprot:31467-Eustigmatos_ZCMA.PRE.1